ncbi:proline racemase family protein [Bacillus badius]|uniref:Not a Proline racemase, nor 4-hydroxyproline epimerase n=1 Tax=Bacillus badius TaxID=1455 RepID=A0ABR5ARQ4_BACBA|nr:proline racemase family protein [Bacillus badius]KIL77438.1 Not a Proline racemase, nor 4-hydroxyproline epimerase [Bacillus badius]KZN98221.1 proline racemase [Bacillus badius]KZR58507.1 proline racemase [Bacillus badius]MED0666671.1 proline racemase family protein [Bacillus badius]MED4717221.1 proline racemase family protein [Bacillus badius]
MHFNHLFTTIDVHVAGEPLRIITGGLPEIQGKTQLERRAYCMEHLDHIRKILMHEPRGHYDMYGCIMTPPANPGSDFGVLFMHNEGWSTMCGHGVIAAVTMAIETGIYQAEGGSRKFTIDCPCGPVTAYAECEGTAVKSVAFENVPSFVYRKEVPIQIDGYEFTADLSYGGAFYAVVDSKEVDLRVSSADLGALKIWGDKIKRYIESQIDVKHPYEEIHGMYGVIFSDEPKSETADLRNVTIFADQQVDRSPCGSGTAARIAALYERGALAAGERFVHESITDGQFVGEVCSVTKIGEYQAVIPKIAGEAFITGFHQFVIDPRDRLNNGFLLA